MQSCENCWFCLEKIGLFECFNIRAPVAGWPTVKPEDWCGEWNPDDKTQAA